MCDPLPYPTISQDEKISRFLVEPKWFNPKTGHISPQAFKPRNPIFPQTTFKTSVYRIDGCSSKDIWTLADEHVNKKRIDGKRVIGRADIKALTVAIEGLRIDPAPQPHPRHADITGWPDQADARLEKAQILASWAEIFLP